MEMRRWFIVAGSAICLCLWLNAEHRANLLAADIDKLQWCQVTIQTVDDTTNLNLNPSLQFPPSAQHIQFPKQLGVIAKDPNTLQVHWIGIEPVTFGVSAEGHETKALKLDKDSEPTIVVRLRPDAAAK
jgi:hypothetical protein